MKQIISLLLLALGMATAAFAQSQTPNEPLFGVFVNGKDAFIDATGRIVFSVPFEHVEPFSEGLAMAFDAGRFGYIDTTGKVVIPLRFAIASRFSEGLAAVSIASQTWKWGFIDRTGRMVIEPQFDQTGDFSEGLALVRVGEVLRYVDPSGRVAIDLHERRRPDEVNLADARHFSNGLAAFIAPDTAKWGFIDKSGKPVIPPRFDAVDRFHEGLARVVLDGRRGYIDTTGAMVLELPSGRAGGPFSQGLAAVQAGDKFGYMDIKGTMVIAPRFDEAKEFVADRARVKIGKAVGYIDKTGGLAIPAHFQEGEDFANSLARVSPSERCSEYIDRDGHVVWRNGGTAKGMPCAEAVVLKPDQPFTDPRDGQRYPTFMIGEKTWLGRNLAFVAPRSWCYDDAATCDADGRLYAWTAARDACPAGWHLPSDDEWQELETSDLAAPPAGRREPNGAYSPRGDAAEFWTSSETDGESAIYRMFSKGGIRRSPLGKSYALSVRCVRGSAAAATPASAKAGSPLEIARTAATEGEAAEASGRVADLHLEALNEAASTLDAYRKLHPDDVEALLLAARVGRLQELGVQMLSAPLPEIGRKREAEERQRARLLELQSLVDRAVKLEPGNAEAHHWNARLFGFSNRTVYGAGPEPGVWDVGRAVLSAKKAVERRPMSPPIARPSPRLSSSDRSSMRPWPHSPPGIR